MFSKLLKVTPICLSLTFICTACGSNVKDTPSTSTAVIEKADSLTKQTIVYQPHRAGNFVLAVLILCAVIVGIVLLLRKLGIKNIFLYIWETVRRMFDICKPSGRRAIKQANKRAIPKLPAPKKSLPEKSNDSENYQVGSYYDKETARREVEEYCAKKHLDADIFIETCGSLDSAIVKIRGY